MTKPFTTTQDGGSELSITVRLELRIRSTGEEIRGVSRSDYDFEPSFQQSEQVTRYQEMVELANSAQGGIQAARDAYETSGLITNTLLWPGRDQLVGKEQAEILPQSAGRTKSPSGAQVDTSGLSPSLASVLCAWSIGV